MSRISEMFPSNFLSAADFPTETAVTIANIETEEVGIDKEERYVIYFQGIEKGMVLNKTNAKMIADLYGDESDEWVGEAITLFATTASYQGKAVPAIRVKPPNMKKKAAAAAASESQKKISAAAVDDEIPF